MQTLISFATELNALAERVAGSLRWFAPLLARLTVGLVFVGSGWGKLHNLEQVTQFFTELGLPAPGFQAILASTTELVCGLLVLVGLATRFASLPLIVVMMVAIRTALWDQVTGLSSLVGLLEFSYIALLVSLAVYGGGAVSLDGLLAMLFARRESAAPRGATMMKLA